MLDDPWVARDESSHVLNLATTHGSGVLEIAAFAWKAQAFARYCAGYAGENVEIVRRIYGGWEVADFTVGVGDLDPHVVLVVQPSFPESGVFVGPEGIARYMRRFLAQWERYEIEAKSLRVIGETVLVEVAQRGKGKVSGVEIDGEYYQLFTFRGGKIVRIESVLEEPEALKAAGLSR